MSYKNCDTIFFESQETNKNLNLSTPPFKKIFQSNEITFPQTLNKSNFQYVFKLIIIELRKQKIFPYVIQNKNHFQSSNHRIKSEILITWLKIYFKPILTIKNKSKYPLCLIITIRYKELYFKFKYHIQNINLIKFILLIKFYYRIEETKPCNCKKSKCLKLYCDCFAANKLCSSKCNCCGCFNNSSNLIERNLYREKMVERNPEAFNQKVKELDYKLAHSKGCNCRKSGCKKKYCECYQMGIECSDNCKCDGCKNCSSNKLVKIFTQQEISQFSRQLKQLSQPF